MRRCMVAARGSRQNGLLCDISVKGIYVRMPEILEPGTPVHVSFDIAAGEPPVMVEAVVMWQNADSRLVPELPPGCGLRFGRMDARDAARVSAVVRTYAPPTSS